MLNWTETEIVIEFSRKPLDSGYMPFVMRSIIGKELKFLGCILINGDCATCRVSAQCPYGALFEARGLYMGNDHTQRISSGMVFEIDPESDTTYRLTFRLFGDAPRFIPMLLRALEVAGSRGYGRARIGFRISSSQSGDRSLNLSSQNDGSPIKTSIPSAIQFVTPMRFQKDGKLQKIITLEDLLELSKRRLSFMGLSAQTLENLGRLSTNLPPYDAAVKWLDLEYWSQTQRKKILMGGIVGTISIKEPLPSPAQLLLSSLEITHGGKNTSFGLGRIRLL